MFKLHKILLPVDFSDASNLALDYAVMLAETMQSELFILHVIEKAVYPLNLGLSKDNLSKLDLEMEKAVEREMAKLAEKINASSVKFTTYILYGSPSEEIVKFAADINADMICISTNGRSGFEHLIFGSTTEKVLRKAPCPVFAVKRKA